MHDYKVLAVLNDSTKGLANKLCHPIQEKESKSEASVNVKNMFSLYLANHKAKYMYTY